jgi:antitoxin component of MazEF toxin-antitoxin module
MIKRLTRHGNSSALVIDKGVLSLLEIDEDTPLEITTDGSVLIITPVRDKRRRRKLEVALAQANLKYGKMLKRLAE